MELYELIEEAKWKLRCFKWDAESFVKSLVSAHMWKFRYHNSIYGMKTAIEKRLESLIKNRQNEILDYLHENFRARIFVISMLHLAEGYSNLLSLCSPEWHSKYVIKFNRAYVQHKTKRM